MTTIVACLPDGSGTVSIQVVSKTNGRYHVQKSFNSSHNEVVLKSLECVARLWADESEFGGALFSPDGAAEYGAVMLYPIRRIYISLTMWLS